MKSIWAVYCNHDILTTEWNVNGIYLQTPELSILNTSALGDGTTTAADMLLYLTKSCSRLFWIDHSRGTQNAGQPLLFVLPLLFFFPFNIRKSCHIFNLNFFGYCGLREIFDCNLEIIKPPYCDSRPKFTG
jgi:hypothetical protein